MALRLNKGLYGLKEAARLWYDELLDALQRHGGVKLTGDSACILFHNQDGKFIGFVIIHVDDIIISGEEKFICWLVAIIKARFKVSKDQQDKFTYTGMAIRVDQKEAIYLNQNQYLEELENIPAGIEDTAFEDKMRTILRGAEGKLVHLNLTRPDVAFKANSLSWVPPGTDLKLKVKEARELINEVKQSQVKIKFAKLS